MLKRKGRGTLFSYKPENKLPSLKKLLENWDLKNLYYKNERDPRFLKDVEKTEVAYQNFAKKYRAGKWKKSPESIIRALQEYLRLAELPGSSALFYLFYRRELNSEDQVAEKLSNLLEERMTKAGNQVLFFELTLAKLGINEQRKLLNYKPAKKFKYYLKSLFEDAKYQLTEPEEKILNLKANTSRSLWINATQKILNKQVIAWKDKEMPINGALMQFEQLPYKERHEMWSEIVPVLERVGEVAENELTALVLDKKISDELRGFKKPYSATTRSYDSTDETLEALVSVVETKGYELSKRFFKLKKKLAAHKLTYIDRNEPIGKQLEFDFKTSVEIVRDVFYGFNRKYGEIFDHMLQNGHIDVYPKKGKSGGAFCNGGVNQPTMLMLNHNVSLDSLRTLAHEMGHAIHGELSKSQPTWYQDHSTLTAETASTFFESLVGEHLLAKANDKDKIGLLNTLIADKLMTIVLCIARFKFELEMHERIRKEGSMNYKDMAKGLAKHFADSVGSSVETKDEHGLIVTSKVHYRMNFYQYSYSFGEIASSIMRSRYRDDRKYAEQVDQFLCAGDKESVENIFKGIGIDMSKKVTFLEGLRILEDEIIELERLTRNKSK